LIISYMLLKPSPANLEQEQTSSRPTGVG